MRLLVSHPSMIDLPNRTLKDLLTYARKKGIIDDYEIGSSVTIRTGSLSVRFEEDEAREFVRAVIQEYEQARGRDGGGKGRADSTH